MAIETAIVSPVLIMMAIGAFQASSIVSRQQELQAGAADVEAIIMAATQSEGAAVQSSDIQQVVMNQLGLTSSQVTLTDMYRCGSATSLVADKTTCTAGTQVYTYVKVVLTDTYNPYWIKYGIGSPVNYTVSRTIQVS